MGRCEGFCSIEQQMLLVNHLLVWAKMFALFFLNRLEGSFEKEM